ncbi:MAG: N-6 DNA methylase [Bacilli bacterium]|nr:N-6 DNA methylase [Bacilli bacterium]
MLTTKNKKAIDACRQILVSKIPSPEGQIEQITMAMLYKFMDDMDFESKKLGGKAKFFSGDYEKYSWRIIMNQKIGAQDRYNLYTEALEKFYIHPTMDPMFKEIFKNANIPFKEADILTLFLREVNTGFDYADSETLGDAYEYLLSDQASQKGLGQFRTPRHIIDMMVEIVQPAKNETILDPACGTAGFLISAFKYIMNHNMTNKPGDKLNYDEKVEVLNHLSGYDIEPKMVKIARMNMFLHGALNPDIYEYDSLTMDSKWDEKFNVILANPPFMTPKGGIKPHKKFSVTASRSEVLFVDYICSHLRAEGRAGIIVPDGIVFQSGKAYKQLRQEMIKNSLYAVISMPSGIFNPYAGVKTSILLLDKKLSKNKKDILFVEMKNDGFSLTSQRTPIKGSEIEGIINCVNSYKDNKEISFENAFVVDKELLLNGDYSLKLTDYKKVEIEKTIAEAPEVIIERLKLLNKEYLTLLEQLGDKNV